MLSMLIAALTAAELPAPPYPPSPLLAGWELDWSTWERRAPGSDNWQLTWADDDHQYAAWGDGGGFGGTNSDGRVSLGVGRVEGPWDGYHGYNVWGGKDAEHPATFTGKSWGLVGVSGRLFMWVSPGSPLAEMQAAARLYVSEDHAATWQPAEWAFTRADGLTIPTICQFGRDYAGARDAYVYHYFIRPADDRDFVAQTPGAIDLVRCPADGLLARDRYEFYAGQRDGQPVWTADLTARQPVFEDVAGVGWNVSVSYAAGLRRYFLMTEHTTSSVGNLGVFEAAEPWGPWQTVVWLNQADETWFGAGRLVPNTFFWNLPTKWQSADGQQFTLIFTGAGRGQDNDSWNSVRGRWVMR